MVADGFATRRGRRGALVHRDEVNGTRARPARRAAARASPRAARFPRSPTTASSSSPEDTFIGTLNEDFAIESIAGDIFQLGNASWRILQVGAGDGPRRRREGRAADHPVLARRGAGAQRRAVARGQRSARATSIAGSTSARRSTDAAVDVADGAKPASTPDAAEQVVAYLAEGRRALGVIPTQETLVLERFFDESGGMQLVLHAPFGSRINKAWGLALRKRFCRQFNFELQAAATEDALLLSLGPQHSFPLADVFRYLHPETTRDVLVQAFLDAPVFQTRWRWNTTISLAVPRNRGGTQGAAAAAADAGRRPDGGGLSRRRGVPREHSRRPRRFPIIRSSTRRSATASKRRWTSTACARVLDAHPSRRAAAASRATRPSRRRSRTRSSTPGRTRSSTTRRSRSGGRRRCRRGAAAEPSAPSDLGALDAAAIARVRDEARPDPRDADELHDALLTAGFLDEAELARVRPGVASTELIACGPRDATAFAGGRGAGAPLLVAAERLPEWLRDPPARDPRPAHRRSPRIPLGPRVDARRGARRAAARPADDRRADHRAALAAHARHHAIETSTTALLALEAEGVVLRGRFTPRRMSSGMGE